jgi:PST family polysaccharide transporter
MSTTAKSDITKKTVHGLAWNYLSHYSGKLLLFISTVILARILTKDEYGVAGYAFVVISFLDIVSDLGIGAALIYHREDPRANDTAFWLGLLVGGVFFGLTWALAPLMALFFNDARATEVIRILGLTFPLASLSHTQEALLRKSMDFKRRFIPDITRSVSKGLFSIIFALSGFGAWSLVLGQVVGTAVSVAAYWVFSPWRPSFAFAPSLVRPLLSYGGGIIAVNALGIILLKVDYLFVGRYMGAEALGTYLLAFRIPELIILQFCGIVAAKVFFPLYASLRDDPSAMGRTYLETTRYMALVTTPLGLGMALVAGPLVLTLFGEKWADAIPVTQAIALYSLLLALSYNAGDAYKARGQTYVLTIVSVARLALLLPALWWAISGFGTIAAVGWAQVAVAFVTGIINLIVVARMFTIPLGKLLAAFHPALVSGALMSVAVLLSLMAVAAYSPAVQLVVAVVVGGLSYAAGLWWLQRDLMLRARKTLRSALSGR